MDTAVNNTLNGVNVDQLPGTIDAIKGKPDIEVQANTDASEKAFRKLVDHVTRTSPVLDILTNPVPVEITFKTRF